MHDGKIVLARYHLVYINPLICQKDCGRVVGLIEKTVSASALTAR